MSGFKNSSLNFPARKNYFEQIIVFLVKSGDLLLKNNVKIENHEERITAHIVENYLKDNSVVDSSFPFAFETECRENFNPNTDTYAGRADIRVSSRDCLFRKNPKDYYTIECKRIDGTSDLNKKYVTKGVTRFVVPPIKYESYHNKNIMFAYVVTKIDIKSNITKINTIHKRDLSKFIAKDISINQNQPNNSCYLCESEYLSVSDNLKLSHIFYDFSSIVI